MSPPKTILVADDEVNLRRVLSGILKRDGHRVVTANDGKEALSQLKKTKVNAVITDLRMPKMDGMELLRHIVAEHPDLPVIIVTAHGSVDNAVTAVKLGAFDYIEKPFEQEQIQQVIEKALRTNELCQSLVRMVGAPEGKGRFGLVGNSSPMHEVFNVIDKVASTPSTVLVTGESGTGKELIALALHENSPRKNNPLIKVNCAAIPDTLIESELFGHEKGAFTGAISSKPGRFELADKGTLFLDEVGEVPIEMQVKLLRALQENEFERVGGVKTIRVDVRLIAATNRDLQADIKTGRFREDLYYRLNVVPIHAPALRDRKEDIPDLVSHILQKFHMRLGKNIAGLAQEATNALVSYDWPGNIRELENLLERSILFCEGPVIQYQDLPEQVRKPNIFPPITSTVSQGGLKELVRAETERVERDLILAALEQTGGNVTHAARNLKISRKSLQNKMKELGLREKEPIRKTSSSKES
ncbi:MAG: sigma-54 dependent transcriptional regulator [Pseudomonadota bacterium]